MSRDAVKWNCSTSVSVPKSRVSISGTRVKLLALLQPIKEIEPERIFREFDSWETDIRALEESFSAQNQKELGTRISETSAAYICHKATSLGVSCSAIVHTIQTENGIPVPASVEIIGPYTEELAAYIENELNISRENQDWRE